MSSGLYPSTIVDFRDALGLAMALADEYAFANAVTLLDSDGAIVDLAIVHGVGYTIEPLLSWATAAAAATQGRGPVAAVLLSVRPHEVGVVREEDLWRYRRGCWTMAAAGLELLDWIETDGDLYRSFANIACPALAWTADNNI